MYMARTSGSELVVAWKSLFVVVSCISRPLAKQLTMNVPSFDTSAPPGAVRPLSPVTLNGAAALVYGPETDDAVA